MRRIAGWVLAAAGVLAVVLGLALAAYLGPDSRRTTGPHSVETSRSVVVTAPRMIRWVDVQIDVLVEVPVSKPIFVGLGNTVDVESLVDDTARLEMTKFATPWKPTFEEQAGEKPTVSGAPTALDWWIADAAGLGGASISTSLPDEPVSLAVVSVGDSNLSGLEMTFAYGIKGGFAKAIGLVLLGGAAVLGGRQQILGRPWFVNQDDEVTAAEDDDLAAEEVVYVYVDEDGVEHELTESELADGEFAVVDDEPDEAEPEGRPEPVYVYVDDDGVEHELTEAELAELGEDVEIVDEDESDGGTR